MAAFLVCDKNIEKNNYLASVGIIAVIGLQSFFNDSMRLPGLYMLIPVSGTVLIILYANKDTFIGQILRFNLVCIWACKLCVLVASAIFAIAKHYFLEELDPLIIGNLLVMIFCTVLFHLKYVEKPFQQNSPAEKTHGKRWPLQVVHLQLWALWVCTVILKRFPNRK